MSDVSVRNQKVEQLIKDFFSKAEKEEYKEIDSSISGALNEVFSSTVWGFREILLVIIIAKLLDTQYKASNAFYKCNPRALYEGPIREFLLERGIPHKKSGPLNVAKATVGINSQWAAQRRPANVANKVVSLVEHIEQFSEEELKNFAIIIASHFLKEAQRVSSLSVEIKPESDPVHLFNVCKDLIENVPDAGNTPQRIIGLLLQSHNEELQLGIKVSGHEDVASVTSTTSKKPGDITEELIDGTILKVYEITVKPFAEARVRESYETVRTFDKNNERHTEEVIVICRKSDVHPAVTDTGKTELYLGKLEYQDLTYHFLDIFEWIMGQIIRMVPDSRQSFYLKFSEYISDPNTAEKVKLYWKSLHD